MPGYFFWELSLLVLGYGLAGWAAVSSTSRDDSAGRLGGAEFVTNGLLLKLLIGATIVQTAALFKAVTPALLYGASAVCALLGAGIWYLLAVRGQGLVGVLLARRGGDSADQPCGTPAEAAANSPGRSAVVGEPVVRVERGKSGSARLANRLGWRVNRLGWPAIWVGIALVLLSPALGSAITLIIETDSVYQSHWVMGTTNGLVTPFEFWFNYVALWQSAYVPGLVLAKSPQLLLLTSVQAVILFVLASYLLARALQLTRARIRAAGWYRLV